MKEGIHPEWFPEAKVSCVCGNTWTTGATVPAIRTDICSNCHPFYTGEQRIVDTEGRVDIFMKRLRHRDDIHAEADAREAAKTPLDLQIAELKLGKRYLNALTESGINVVSDFLNKLTEGGDEAILEIPGIGRKILSDMKRQLRTLGYELPETD